MNTLAAKHLPATPHSLFDQMAEQLLDQGFRISHQDRARPWGGFFVIAEAQAQHFADVYFEGLPVEALRIAGPLSPMLVLVAPHQRLSWQYHRRRAEVCRVLRGPVGLATSPTDAEGPLQTLQSGQQISLCPGERHRLVGLDDWSVLAEIWQHTDAQHPSDEADIVRVQDDFGR